MLYGVVIFFMIVYIERNSKMSRVYFKQIIEGVTIPSIISSGAEAGGIGVK